MDRIKKIPLELIWKNGKGKTKISIFLKFSYAFHLGMFMLEEQNQRVVPLQLTKHHVAKANGYLYSLK